MEQLRQEGFDEAVVLPHSVRSAWLVFRAGIPHRWGYRGRFPESSFRRPLLKPAVRGPKRDGRHQVEDYRELLTALAIPHPKSWTPRLEVTAELQRRGRSLLERARLTATGGPVIGLFPGAEFGPSKRWPWRRFAELGRLLRRHDPNSHQVILAGPKEVWMGVRIHEETGKIHPVVGPDLDLAELAAVLSQLDLLITNDSGPMHLAAALGVPCVALFGPTDPQRTRPSGTRHQILYTDRWCSPCFRRRCPLIHHRCLRDIGVEGVLAKCQEILEK